VNTSTKTWLMELLYREEDSIRRVTPTNALIDERITPNGGLNMLIARVNDARRLVEQGPEEPRR
jgi:hypothetical protein